MELATNKVIPEKYFGIAAILYSFKGFKYIIIEAPADKIDGQEHR
jgi:hypothetical protein